MGKEQLLLSLIILTIILFIHLNELAQYLLNFNAIVEILGLYSENQGVPFVHEILRCFFSWIIKLYIIYFLYILKEGIFNRSYMFHYLIE
jgi:hypothetical protein